jgi:DNA-binding transcriptional regulator YhcF (GntR family)
LDGNISDPIGCLHIENNDYNIIGIYHYTVNTAKHGGVNIVLISIDRNNPLPIYLQIRNNIRELIVSGTLPTGYKLPPERKLAETLKINRSTVLNAHRELKADGYISSHIGQGTVVCPYTTNQISQDIQSPAPIIWRQLFNQSISYAGDTLVRDLLELANRDNIISFAAGIAVPGSDPLDSLNNIQNRLIKLDRKLLF